MTRISRVHRRCSTSTHNERSRSRRLPFTPRCLLVRRFAPDPVCLTIMEAQPAAAVVPPPALAEPAAPLVAAAEAFAAAVPAPPQHEAPPLTAPPAKRIKRRKERRPSFNDMLFELLQFRAKNGHCRVPLKTKIGKWVTSMRAQYLAMQTAKREGKSRDVVSLTPDRIEVLSSIGFVWDVIKFDSDQRWQKHYDELAAFREMNGHTNVPQSAGSLGKWCKMMREQYKETQLKLSGIPLAPRAKRRTCLSQDRIEKLELLGFEWRMAPPAVGWETRYLELAQYRRVYGDCLVPQAWAPNPSLGRWVMKQRCQMKLKQEGKRSQLNDERISKLDALGFTWNTVGVRQQRR